MLIATRNYFIISLLPYVRVPYLSKEKIFLFLNNLKLFFVMEPHCAIS
jgi:hypothetical protein